MLRFKTSDEIDEEEGWVVKWRTRDRMQGRRLNVVWRRKDERFQYWRW